MATTFGALVALDLRVPGCRSLKEKRSVVKSLVARLRREVNCAVAETGHQDLHQRAALGVAVVSGTPGGATTVADHVLRVVERELRVEIIAAPVTVVADE